MPAKKWNTAVFFAAFKNTGSIGEAAAIAGIHRSAHYRKLQENPSYQKAFEALCAELESSNSGRALRKGAEERLRSEIRALGERVHNLAGELRRRLRALEAGATPNAPRPKRVPEEVDSLLDQIARGMAKKPFSKLPPAHQDAVRSIAARMKGEEPD